ncbi:MAG: flagellar filament capping protein FliD [bacterium]|nr:flagellar filament capping protein FliD [bacterium]
MPQSFMGIGSGFNISGMIDALMGIERRPIIKWQDQQLQIEKKKDAWRDVNSRLKSLRDKTDTFIGELVGETMWSQAKATSADESIVKVTPGSDVATGVYDLRIRRLATAAKSKSSSDLNTKYAAKSSGEVRAGLDKKIDVKKNFAEAGFDTTPDGTITVSIANTSNTWTSNSLSSYSTVQDFIDAASANSFMNMRYDESSDRFIIEKTSTDTNGLVLSQSGTNGFLTEVNIAAGTYNSSTAANNKTGIDVSAKLYKANFNNMIAEAASGSFKINGVEFSWDADVDTLNGLLGKINRSDAGVTAFYDEDFDKVMVTTKEMGASTIEISDVTGTFALGTLLLPNRGDAGEKAQFTINSADDADQIEKDTNTFTIGGVAYDLKKISKDIDENAADPYTSAQPTKITVVRDEEGIYNKIGEFVKQFNSTMEFLAVTSKNSDKESERGFLAGDSTVYSFSDRLLNYVTKRYSELNQDKYDELSEIGITTKKYVRGKAPQLEIEENKLKEAIRNNPTKVQNLFAKDTDDDLKKDVGVAVSIVDYLKPLTTFGGSLENRVRVETDIIQDLKDRITKFEKNLTVVEERYKRNFGKMDRAYAFMNNQMGMLFGSMPRSRYR